MKDWFKHDKGFVNIDLENIYFTHSGNWSEARELKESAGDQSTSFQQFMTKAYIVIAIILGILIFFNLLAYGSLWALAIPIGLNAVYNYLKTDIGPKFKLPIAKITEIEIEENSIEFNYLDLNDKDQSVTIKTVQDKGMHILEALKADLNNRV